MLEAESNSPSKERSGFVGSICLKKSLGGETGLTPSKQIYFL